MPAGNGLLQRYIGLLSVDSQKKLGSFILNSFIGQDIAGPSLEAAMAEAERDAPARLANYQDWVKRWPEYYSQYENYTLEQTFNEIKNEVLRRYLGSAISDKGMLALICGIEGHLAVTTLRNYMRDHYQRRAQIEAMIDAVATSNDPLIIQLLLSLSRRYRTASVQEKRVTWLLRLPSVMVGAPMSLRIELSRQREWMKPVFWHLNTVTARSRRNWMHSKN